MEPIKSNSYLREPLSTSRMPPNGTWDFTGSHKQSRQYDPAAAPQPRPTYGDHRRPELQGEYELNAKSPNHPESLRIYMIFSAHDFSGQTSTFEIEGSGILDVAEFGPEVWKRGEEVYQARFRIVPGSGTNRYAGMSGSGENLIINFEREDEYVTKNGYMLRVWPVRGAIEFQNIVNGGIF
ncbi:MAG: hypothetical protein Q9213_004195 [Squamulea squamosa]